MSAGREFPVDGAATGKARRASSACTLSKYYRMQLITYLLVVVVVVSDVNVMSQVAVIFGVINCSAIT